MKKHIKFPSIEQFRTIVTNVNRSFNYIGQDENDNAIYDHSIQKPTLNFKGTIKLHGTNASVCFNSQYGFWTQSRSNIITPEQDNAKFASFAYSKEEEFMRLIHNIAVNNDVDLFKNTITIFGEWVGNGIQKNVGISNIEKSFFIFGVKIKPILKIEEESIEFWVNCKNLRNKEHKIYNINDYKTYSIDIDFNNPELAQNTLVDLTMEVEQECPISKEFGFLGVGEGIVWTSEFKGKILRFKTKGDKYSGKSKTKIIKKVDDEKIKKLLEFSEKVTPTWRLQQMLEESCDFMNGGHLERSKLGNFIKLVIKDIIKEEKDLLISENLEIKDISKYISEISKRYFFEREKEF